jgi:hypothetical protein
MTFFLPMRRASSAWPMQLLILCALQIYFRALARFGTGAQRFGQAAGIVKRIGATDIGAQQFLKLGFEIRVLLCVPIDLFQFQDDRHQRFGDVATAKGAEMAGRIRLGAERVADGHNG